MERKKDDKKGGKQPGPESRQGGGKGAGELSKRQISLQQFKVFEEKIPDGGGALGPSKKSKKALVTGGGRRRRRVGEKNLIMS